MLGPLTRRAGSHAALPAHLLSSPDRCCRSPAHAETWRHVPSRIALHTSVRCHTHHTNCNITVTSPYISDVTLHICRTSCDITAHIHHKETPHQSYITLAHVTSHHYTHYASVTSHQHTVTSHQHTVTSHQHKVSKQLRHTFTTSPVVIISHQHHINCHSPCCHLTAGERLRCLNF